jgi:hypothetical protein
MNQALDVMGVSDNNFTYEDDILDRGPPPRRFLRKIIEQGILLLKNYRNDRLDPDCNRVCLTNALILLTVLEKVKLSDELSDLRI